MNRIPALLCSILLAASAGWRATAQEADPPADAVEDIVVTARRIEGPMWEVRRGDSVLILVGAIDGLPRDDKGKPQGNQGMFDRIALYRSGKAFVDTLD